jgi:hypothetical protein
MAILERFSETKNGYVSPRVPIRDVLYMRQDQRHYTFSCCRSSSGALPFAVTASVAGDGNSHLVALQGYGYFIINSSDSELGPTIPVMTLVLAQSI